MELNASARIMPDWSRKLLYLHKNSEKQNSDANLQSQFSHVFPSVWGRHVHDSWDNPSSENETEAAPVSSEGWSLCNPPEQSERFPTRCSRFTHHRAPPSPLGHLKPAFSLLFFFFFFSFPLAFRLSMLASVCFSPLGRFSLLQLCCWPLLL